MNRRRFVIIGCGRIAYRHAEQILKRGEITAVCDPDPEKLRLFTQKYKVPGFPDVQSLFSATTASVAVVCSPNYLHTEHSAHALQKGMHVLCEKPLCLTKTDGHRLAKLVNPGGPQLFVVLSARYHPVIRRLKSQLNAGLLGRVLSFQLNASWNRNADYYRLSSWKGQAGKDGGILFTQFSHYIDALTWCLGDIDPVAVNTRNFIHSATIEGEDTGTALLESSGGAIGSLHWTVNSTSRNMEISLVLIGEKGSVKIGGTYMDELQFESLEQPQAPENFVRSADLIDEQPRSHHDQVYLDLERALDDKENSMPGISEALQSVSLIEKIYSCSKRQVNQG
ncbi:Gfo/Idh/MocA family protein [Flavihumibacter solisilvae]|uniref:Oxidoreductase n=1 Tax=Flavihumibacter solisilvae TaxID=1349421 RepID=A0A0C1L2W7_9BACT|nr:Gfo/Idh/MocA family oxidoreductase [Flavihumibacter solisilvae]KIC93921.1 hypothetical protein OI18_15165 [Flavihumibacter solisilvae]